MQVLEGVRVSYVLIFNLGQPEEGVYTLQGRQSPTSYVLAFEGPEEAARFAELLQAEGFDLAAPVEWATDRVTDFCTSMGFEIGFVPSGTLITPPENNSYDVEAYEQLKDSDAREAEVERERRPAQGLTIEVNNLEHLFFDL
jgi:hypothetical protein